MNTWRENSEARLAALFTYDIMDTESEGEFDALVRLAAHIAGTPIALITLLDERRQWFKAKIGIPISETPLEQAFCRYTIQGDDAMEVEDAQLDDRFVTNLLVTGEPHIRYYCGLPLLTPEGFRLGSLCVIDREPRQLGDAQREALQTLAGEVMARLELKRQKKLIESQKQLLEQSNQQLEVQVEQRTQDLWEANTALSAAKSELDLFLYRASHDLKGPLCTLQGLVQLVETDPNPVAQAQYVQGMQHSILKLDRVLDSLLTYSQNVQQPLCYKPINFAAMIEHILESLKEEKGFSNLRMKFHFTDLVPFYSDHQRLVIVLTNLLKNCINFQNYHLEQAEVTIWLTCTFHRARIMIQDNGIGIPDAQLEKIGHRFSRHSSQSTGPGLGLFITHEVLQKLDGTLQVQSKPGQGTIVTLELPNASSRRKMSEQKQSSNRRTKKLLYGLMAKKLFSILSSLQRKRSEENQIPCRSASPENVFITNQRRSATDKHILAPNLAFADSQ